MAMNGRYDPFMRTPLTVGGASIRHYYGDLVRQLLLGAATLMLIGAPFYVDEFSVQMPFIVAGALVYIGLAALMNPWKQWVIGASAACAGAGIIIYELWALWYYTPGEPIQFVLRQIPAVLLIFAFYFSLKTFRAMMMGIIGKQPDIALSHRDDDTDEIDEYLPHAPEEVHDEVEEVAYDALGNPAAPTVDKGGD